MGYRPFPGVFLLVVVMLHGIAIASADDDFAAVEHRRRRSITRRRSRASRAGSAPGPCPTASLMVSFTQATGPVEGRPQAPKEVQQKLTWPPAGHPGYDMTGLDLRNVHLRSTDAGKTWKQVSADAFKSCMNGVTGEAETALADGTVVRGVWGYYLPYDPELPKTGYLQRSQRRHEDLGQARGAARPEEILGLAEANPRAARRPADRARRRGPRPRGQPHARGVQQADRAAAGRLGRQGQDLEGADRRGSRRDQPAAGPRSSTWRNSPTAICYASSAASIPRAADGSAGRAC